MAFGVLAGFWVYETTSEPASVTRTGPSRSNLAVQSGALVAGLVGGAITLWLNEHRRRHNEQQLAQDRERIEEERFARAVELLGHDRAAVRVGAMHALAGLVGSAAARAQTVIDTLCAYLRQPFSHPEWDRSDTTPADPAGAGVQSSTIAAGGPTDERAEADREREVRRTALRLITALLPDAVHLTEDTSIPVVDLSAAQLDELDLSHKALNLRAPDARFRGGADFTGAHLNGDVTFTKAHFAGNVTFTKAHFAGNATFTKAHFAGPAEFDGAHFDGDATFTKARFDEFAGFGEAHFAGDAWFGEAHFDGNAWFGDEAYFAELAEFSMAHFAGNTWFDQAHFDGNAQFLNAYFAGPAEFNMAHFAGNTWFTAAHFDGDARFLDAYFAANAEFTATYFAANAEFTATHFHGNAMFAEARFSETLGIVLDRANFAHNLVLPVDAPLASVDGATANGMQRVVLPRGWKLIAPGEPKSQLIYQPEESG